MTDERLEALIQAKMDAARQALMDFCLQDTTGPGITFAELLDAPSYGSPELKTENWWK